MKSDSTFSAITLLSVSTVVALLFVLGAFTVIRDVKFYIEGGDTVHLMVYFRSLNWR